MGVSPKTAQTHQDTSTESLSFYSLMGVSKEGAIYVLIDKSGSIFLLPYGSFVSYFEVAGVVGNVSVDFLLPYGSFMV